MIWTVLTGCLIGVAIGACLLAVIRIGAETWNDQHNRKR